MRERLKTGILAVTALALGIAAAVVQPESAVPAIFSDQGTIFYPKFTDPQSAKTIEVVDYDEATATATPLKVQFQKGKWLIVSNYDYPVDIGDRLAKTAASLIDLKRDIVRSDSAQDHAHLGTLDPLDPKAGLSGRGKRVTLRDAHGDVLADFIFGKPAEGKPGYRYVRVPTDKRTYAVKTDADPSARFADWVNANILRLSTGQIRKVTINHYNIDPAGRLANAETKTITEWKTPEAQALAATLTGLKIVDVRPKPPTLAEDLRNGQLRLSLETAVSLRQKGYFLSENGRIFASEGAMTVETNTGLIYTLRFGEVATTGNTNDNRHLFVTASPDPAGAGEQEAKALNARFANWYYIISNKDFQKLQTRKPEAAPKPAPVAPGAAPASPTAAPRPR